MSGSKQVDDGSVSLTVPGSAEYLRLVRLAAADCGARADLSIEEVDDLRIAVDELSYVLIGEDPVGEALTLRYARVSGRCRDRGQLRARGEADGRERAQSVDHRRRRRRARDRRRRVDPSIPAAEAGVDMSADDEPVRSTPTTTETGERSRAVPRVPANPRSRAAQSPDRAERDARSRRSPGASRTATSRSTISSRSRCSACSRRSSASTPTAGSRSGPSRSRPSSVSSGGTSEIGAGWCGCRDASKTFTCGSGRWSRSSASSSVARRHLERSPTRPACATKTCSRRSTPVIAIGPRRSTSATAAAATSVD